MTVCLPSCPLLMGSVLGFDRVPWWGTLCIALGCAVVTALVVWFVVCPRLKRKIKREYVAAFTQETNLKRVKIGLFV